MVSQILRRLTASAAIAGIILAAVGSILALGGQFNGWLDVVGQFTPIWFFIGPPLALVAAALCRKGRQVCLGLGLMVLLLSGGRLAPEWIERIARQSQPAAEGDFSLVQLNLWKQNRDIPTTIKWLLSQNADVLVLHEAAGANRDIVQAARIHYPYRTTCAGQSICSTMILSKTPPLASGGLYTSGHGTAPVLAAWAIFNHVGGPVTVVGVHPTWPIPPGAQNAEMAAIVKLTDTLPHQRLVLSGDFNSTPWSFALRRADDQIGIPRLTHGEASWPAWIGKYRFPWPLLAIDQVYAGDGWRPVSVLRGPRLGSDHYPIAVTLAPNP